MLTKPRTAATPNVPGTYANPKTFQIYSAGKNKRFGFDNTAVGPRLWTAGTGAFVDIADGGDDFSNFSPVMLGIVQ
jgi:hypothetical protein